MSDHTHATEATIRTLECEAQRAAYRRASEIIAKPLERIPDGHVAVSALDGITAVVPAPATLANGNAPVTATEAATAACGALPGRG